MDENVCQVSPSLCISVRAEEEEEEDRSYPPSSLIEAIKTRAEKSPRAFRFSRACIGRFRGFRKNSPVELTDDTARFVFSFDRESFEVNKKKRRENKRKEERPRRAEQLSSSRGARASSTSLTFTEVKVQRSWSNRFAITVSLRPIHTGFAYLCDDYRETRVYLVRCFAMRHAGG